MGNKIHKTAVISPSVELGDGVVIDENTVIRDNVIIEDNVHIGTNVLIEGKTRIGAGTEIFHSSTIGLAPQDLKYNGEPTRLIIGRNNTIREFCSIHRGTAGGNGITRVGDNNLIMAYCHIAHDSQIGNGTILANAVNMGGHTEIEDFAVIGGMVAIHQFVHIGSLAMVGAASYVAQDVLPYAMISGNPAKVVDINRIGLRRKNFDTRTIDEIHKAIVIIARSGLALDEAIERIKSKLNQIPEIVHILKFIENRSRRGLMRGKKIR